MKVGDKRFYGKVIAIVPLSSLSEYVGHSGFESVEELEGSQSLLTS